MEDQDPDCSRDDGVVGGEEMVVLDDASEVEREENLDHQISTTSDDVLVGISGEGAELHPEFDDFEDDQQYEVLDSAGGDVSGESLGMEQSPKAGENSPNEEKVEQGEDKDGEKREKVSPEKSGTSSKCSQCVTPYHVTT